MASAEALAEKVRSTVAALVDEIQADEINARRSESLSEKVESASEALTDWLEEDDDASDARQIIADLHQQLVVLYDNVETALERAQKHIDLVSGLDDRLQEAEEALDPNSMEGTEDVDPRAVKDLRRELAGLHKQIASARRDMQSRTDLAQKRFDLIDKFTSTLLSTRDGFDPDAWNWGDENDDPVAEYQGRRKKS